MKLGSGWKPLGFTALLLSLMFISAAFVGTGPGAAGYQIATQAVPIEPPPQTLNIPKAARDDELTAMEWTAWAALIGAITGVMTFGILFLTLRNTEKLLAAAQDTNELAKETLAATTASAEAQMRAYLCFEKPSILANHQGVGIRVEVANMGHSPAFRVSVRDFHVSFTAVNSGARQMFTSRPPGDSRVFIGKSIQVFGHQHQPFPMFGDFPQSEHQEILHLIPTTEFLVSAQGTFYYEDVFDKGIEERFAFTGMLNRGAASIDIFAIVKRSVTTTRQLPEPSRR